MPCVLSCIGFGTPASRLRVWAFAFSRPRAFRDVEDTTIVRALDVEPRNDQTECTQADHVLATAQETDYACVLRLSRVCTGDANLTITRPTDAMAVMHPRNVIPP